MQKSKKIHTLTAKVQLDQSGLEKNPTIKMWMWLKIKIKLRESKSS